MQKTICQKYVSYVGSNVWDKTHATSETYRIGHIQELFFLWSAFNIFRQNHHNNKTKQVVIEVSDTKKPDFNFISFVSQVPTFLKDKLQ